MFIADDDWDLADALALRIKGLGLGTRTAHDALTTMRILQSEPPDLLILDVRLPDGDGLSVCETMAQDVDLAHIPVLILTGLNDPTTVRRCCLSGARYVFKGPDVWRRIEPFVRRLAHADHGTTPTSRVGEKLR